VTEVRGRGLLLGIEFVSSDIAADFMMSLLEHRVLPSYSLNANSVLRLTPPALLDEEDLRWLAEALDAAARELADAVPALTALPSS
jgi:putrescine aminotransferase